MRTPFDIAVLASLAAMLGPWATVKAGTWAATDGTTAAASAAPSGWITTVIRTEQNVLDAAGTNFKTTVVAMADRDLATTGSIARSGPSVPEPLGPRITGPSHAMQGVASYYWEDQVTATGERFNKRAMTAAHRTLPFGTRVKVTNGRNGKSVVVRINDRGPFKRGRIIDLSERAAEGLGMTGAGTAHVSLEVLGD